MKKIWKRLLIGLGVLVGLLLVTALVLYLVLDKPLPEGKTGPEAEALTDKMLTAVNAAAWDSVQYLHFVFAAREHEFLWDMQNQFVEAKWDGKRALLDANEMRGQVWEDGQEVTGKEKRALLKEANRWFTNDVFWLVGFLKVRDPGTERRVVELEGGQQALLVTYTKGGLTPGDSYLWILDDKGLPVAWQMWVDIIPIGGLEFSWAGWKRLPEGAMVPQMHAFWFMNINFSDVRSGKSLAEMGADPKLFDSLQAQRK